MLARMSQCRFRECVHHGVGVQYTSVTASCRDWQHRCLLVMSPRVQVSATQTMILDNFLSPSRQKSNYFLKFSQDRCLPHPSPFITAWSFYHSTLVIHRKILITTVIKVGSNMTGTDLCVNLATSVPVIFEPLCTCVCMRVCVCVCVCVGRVAQSL